MSYLFKVFLILTAVVYAATTNGQVASRKADQPNVIMLLVDDLGWRDLGYMGSKFYETPNIDQLARSGMIFTNAYAAAAICSPTRAALLTGKYPARTGITDWIRARYQLNTNDVKAPEPYENNGNRKLRTPSNPFWMELREVTLAELLKKNGYFTTHIGKWHLGTDEFYPEKQGYDLNIAGNDMGQPVNYFDPYINDQGVGFPNVKSRMEGEYLEDRLSSEMKTVIEEHKDAPFFISMCFYAVHTPLMAKEDIVKKYASKRVVDSQKNTTYAAMLESLDQSVGNMMNTLSANNLMENTIIVFVSDNGGLIGPTDNSPLRSGKGYAYEGGIRVPMFVYWKGRIAANTVSDLPVTSVDILPTICALTKTPLPQGRIDGRDISKALQGSKATTVPLYWHFPHYRTPDVVPYSIIRDGDWKLIKRYEGKTFELFNLKNDISEKTELSKDNPAMVAKLSGQLDKWLKETGAKMPLVKE